MLSLASALSLPANFGPAAIFGPDLNTGVIIAGINVLIAIFAGANFGARGLKGEGTIRRVSGWGLKILIGLLATVVSVLGVTEAAEEEREKQATKEYQQTVTTALADLLLHGTNTTDLGEGSRSIDAIVDKLPADVRERILKEQPVLAVAVPRLNEVPANANANTNANAQSGGSRSSQSNNGRTNADGTSGMNDLSGNTNSNSNSMDDANARMRLTETELAALRWLQKADGKLYVEVMKEVGRSRRVPDDVIAKYKAHLENNPDASSSLGDRLRSASDMAASNSSGNAANDTSNGASDGDNPGGNERNSGNVPGSGLGERLPD